MSTASVLVVSESLADMVARPDGTAVEHAGLTPRRRRARPAGEAAVVS
jgi:hypothetical protein